MIIGYRKRKKRKPGLYIIFPLVYISLLLGGLLTKIIIEKL
jgi:hypothetical protein